LARKILLADDSVTAQNMGRKILADAGYEVITVNNGSAALKKVSEQKPDLIVLDVYMPGYSGLEVCQRLKETGDTSRIPILLTVGKLEPFKPEEAKRVRADAFIVKPFEASELLSALSKLEDKVVPRSEPSKPGRFARATAAIDERFDRSMAVEEDSGWKSRIVFPKKKEKEAEADVDDAAIYNPVNKDLRTVVEHKPDEHRGQPPAEQERVNLSALAPDGLPKDVTPEEIAALAAAAAQVKGTIAEEKTAAEAPAEKAAEVPAPKGQEESIAASPEFPVVKAEDTENKEQSPSPEILSQFASAAAQDAVEKESTEQVAKEAPLPPSTSEVNAAVGVLEQRATEESKRPEDAIAAEAARVEEPATMAVAAAAGAGGPRWTAVAVALSPEEASLSLEEEMQKAASFAVAAEPERAETTPASSRPDPATMAMAEPAPVIDAPGPIVEASTAPTRIEETSVAPSAGDLSGRGSEPPVAASTEATFVAPASEELSLSPSAEPAAVTSAESSLQSSSEVEEATSVQRLQPDESVETKTAEVESSDVAVGTASVPESAQEAKSEEESLKDQVSAEEKVVAEEVSEPVTADVDSDPVPEKPVGDEPSATRNAGSTDETTTKEPDITATTAAAWASWRRIRETDDGKAVKDSGDVSDLKDKAAMAVAVGAEGSPEEVAALDGDPEIANIVDSVLADMRPKIVQEIAKKLGKKK
jgi:CheY-like chemotaxis protein